MKIIAIGDTHGKSVWKEVVNKELDNCDKFIFIGDYFDCYGKLTQAQEIDNFK